MQSFSKAKRIQGKTIGFVPTMGYLHEGHLSLVRKAKELSDVVIASIFVNPTQFAPNEDFTKYPRDEEKDKRLLMQENVDALFLPSVNEIYQPDFQTYVDVERITKGQEGEFRPTHFKGVTTIVSILFNSVMPDMAVFGQKDAQQAAIINRMIDDLKYDIKMIIAPTVREEDGLALSSRNVYLSEKERRDALVLSKALQFAEKQVNQGERKVFSIIQGMRSIINSVDTSNPDYIKIVDLANFEEVNELIPSGKYYILIACRIGSTRLIDNILVEL